MCSNFVNTSFTECISHLSRRSSLEGEAKEKFDCRMYLDEFAGTTIVVYSVTKHASSSLKYTF